MPNAAKVATLRMKTLHCAKLWKGNNSKVFAKELFYLFALPGEWMWRVKLVPEINLAKLWHSKSFEQIFSHERNCFEFTKSSQQLHTLRTSIWHSTWKEKGKQDVIKQKENTLKTYSLLCHFFDRHRMRLHLLWNDLLDLTVLSWTRNLTTFPCSFVRCASHATRPSTDIGLARKQDHL